MKQADVDEALVALYLRLNGYFTSGLVIHSPIHGQAKTEVDCLAVRLPHHSQIEREVGDAPFLDTRPGVIDLIICEVKSDPKLVAFNTAMQSNVGALASIIGWAGISDTSAAADLAKRLQPLLADRVNADEARAGVTEQGVRVRALLCCPPLATPGARWYLTGTEILRYANECFNPPSARPNCSVRYNFQQWGLPYRHIVTWLKDGKNAGAGLEALYRHMGLV